MRFTVIPKSIEKMCDSALEKQDVTQERRWESITPSRLHLLNEMAYVATRSILETVTRACKKAERSNILMFSKVYK